MKEKLNIKELEKAKVNVNSAIESEEVSFNYDGRQLFVRIPNKFNESLKINKNKDKFLFELQLPGSSNHFKKAQLKGTLVRGVE